MLSSYAGRGFQAKEGLQSLRKFPSVKISTASRGDRGVRSDVRNWRPEGGAFGKGGSTAGSARSLTRRGVFMCEVHS